MQIAQVLAGYSLGEADLLRRAMGKKDSAEMARQKTRFMTGAVAKGFEEQKVSDLFDLVAKFAEYGFNKSHSAAYGYIAYQTGWLKAHHRAEYMAALMSIDAGDSDKILVYVGDCRKAGMKILPPDINMSVGPFDVRREDRRSIRYGLNAVKGVGEGAVAAVMEARAEAGGQFQDFMDCLNRLDYRRVNRRVLESFIKCGAFDSLGDPRARLLAALEDAMGAAQQAQAQKASGQVGLFGGAMKAPAFKLPKVSEWAVGERMKYEKETLGLYLTGHPIEAYADEVRRFATAPIDGLRRIDDKGKVAVAGIVAAMRIIRTAKGDKMAFVTLEDITGSVECLFFPKALPKSQAALESKRPVLLRGVVEHKADETKILADTVELLDDIGERETREVCLKTETHLLTEEALAQIGALVERESGSAWFVIQLREPGVFQTRIRSGETVRVRATQKLREGLAAFGTVSCS